MMIAAMAIRRDGCVFVNMTELVRVCSVGAMLPQGELRSSTWMDSTSTATNALASSVQAPGLSGVGLGVGAVPDVLVCVAPANTVLVGEALGRAEQPLSARFTAMISSLTVTSPFMSASNGWQAVRGKVSKAMFTPRISSLIVTLPSSLQSPTQAASTDCSATKMRSTALAKLPVQATIRCAACEIIRYPARFQSARSRARPETGADQSPSRTRCQSPSAYCRVLRFDGQAECFRWVAHRTGTAGDLV